MKMRTAGPTLVQRALTRELAQLPSPVLTVDQVAAAISWLTRHGYADLLPALGLVDGGGSTDTPGGEQ